MSQSDPLASRVISLIRRRFGLLWLAAAWPYAAEAIVFIGGGFYIHARAAAGEMQSPMQIWESFGSAMKAVLFLAFSVQIFLPRDLACGGTAIIVKAERRDESLGLGTFLARLCRALVPMIPFSVVIGLLILVGGLLILPGIFLAIATAMVMPALATAETHSWDAVGQSLKLSLKRFGPLLGIYVITGIAQVVALFLLIAPNALLAGASVWWASVVIGWGLFAIVMSSIIMVQSIAVALLYLETCEQAGTPLVANPN
jgi:hypothetical protein